MLSRRGFLLMLAHFDMAIFCALVRHAQPFATPQQSMHAGEKDLQLERLGQIIVSSDIEPLQNVFRAAARGQHQDGDELPPLTQFLRYSKTVNPRKHDIKHDSVIGLLAEHLQRAFAITGDGDLVAFGFKVEAQAIGQVLFIFDNKDVAHALLPDSAFGNSNVNVLPWFSPGLSAKTRPPWRLAIDLT